MTRGAELSVLHVNTSDAGGGAEAVALDLHRGLLSLGIGSELAVGFRRTDAPSVVELPLADGLGSRLYSAARTAGKPRLARLARSISTPGVLADLALGHEDFRFPGSHSVLELAQSVDVVHLHNLHGGYFDLRLLPQLTRLRPTVITLHDEWTYTGHCALTLGSERWRDACGACPHLDVYPRLRRDGTAYNLRRKREIWGRSQLHVVAPTRWLIDRAKESAIRDAAQTWNVISNGIDLDIFKPSEQEAARLKLGLPREARILVFAAPGARTSKFKDYPTLQRALRLIGGRTGPPVIAITVGDAGETMREGRVELRHAGFLDRDQLALHFAAADLYVHPALAEVQGLTLMEALATGLPAVASSVGGIPDVVRDGDTGLLVPAEDPAALAAAIEGLLHDDSRRAAMSLAAADDARARFGEVQHVDAYRRVYETALKSETVFTSPR